MVDVVSTDRAVTREPFGYRKVDARTVEFRLPAARTPAADIFPSRSPPASQAAYKAGAFNAAWGSTPRSPKLVSSGPYVIAEYAPGQRVVYQRNPALRNQSEDGKPLPYLDRYVPDLNATTLNFRSNVTDVLAVQAPGYYHRGSRPATTACSTAARAGVQLPRVQPEPELQSGQEPDLPVPGRALPPRRFPRREPRRMSNDIFLGLAGNRPTARSRPPTRRSTAPGRPQVRSTTPKRRRRCWRNRPQRLQQERHAGYQGKRSSSTSATPRTVRAKPSRPSSPTT